MVEEIWKTAVYDDEVYEGLYKVSNLGRILSLNYNGTGKAKLMKPNKNKGGYFRVGLWKNGKQKKYFVHQLVATAFLENPENKPYINHKIEGDEGKTMNMVIFNEDGTIDKKRTTIEWCTAKENNDYGTHNERNAKARINGKRSKKVLQFTLDGKFIREWPSVAECERNGFNHSAVCNCCKGKHKSHKGFLWRYK